MPRSALVLGLLVLATALPVGAAAPPGPAPGTPERVQLRWKVSKEAPLAYNLVTTNVAPRQDVVRFDLSTIQETGPKARRHKELFEKTAEFQMPDQSTLAVLLSPLPSGDMAAKVVVTQMAFPKSKKKKSKEDRQLEANMKKMVGKVQLRANLTAWGFVTTDLKVEQRNLLALMFELPSKPVAVGDTWTHSADMVKMGNGWEGEVEKVNRVELAGLQKEAEGRTVAIVDFSLGERNDGKFEDRRGGRVIPATMENVYMGRGEFLVEEGRWRRVTGRFITRASGVMKAESDQEMTLTPLDPIPPKVLAAE